jgi:hypothetical protein
MNKIWPLLGGRSVPGIELGYPSIQYASIQSAPEFVSWKPKAQHTNSGAGLEAILKNQYFQGLVTDDL